jgi:hypothetical protein
MKRLMAVALVLSWIILVLGCLFLLFGLLAAMTTRDMRVFTVFIIFAAIPLHSYASLQLRKSILHPDIPLAGQTRFGLRVAGFVALFIGFLSVMSGLGPISNPDEYLKQWNELMPNAKNVYTRNMVVGAGIISLLFSLAIIVNVVINLRLLRLYLIGQQKKSGE